MDAGILDAGNTPHLARGSTALHIAAARGSVTCCNVLLDFELAHPGKTALDLLTFPPCFVLSESDTGPDCSPIACCFTVESTVLLLLVLVLVFHNPY